MMDRIPVEILLRILEYLPQRDLANFSQTSKVSHQISIPLLHKILAFRATENELEISRPKCEKTCFAWNPTKEDFEQRSFSRLRYVKEVLVYAPISKWVMDRCFVHYDDEDEGEERSVVNFEEEDGVHGETMEGLWIGLQGVLKRLDAGVIKTFRWHLGCCIPAEILSEGGLIPRTQPDIKFLSLITQGDCGHAESLAGLQRLANIHYFSWRGFHQTRNRADLARLLVRNCQHLESVELEQQYQGEEGLVDPVSLVLFTNSRTQNNAQGQNENEGGSIGNGNGNGPPSPRVIFPVLQHLTLGEVDLSSLLDGISPTFQLENLRTLKLRYCRGAIKFLQRITPAPISIMAAAEFIPAIATNSSSSTTNNNNNRHSFLPNLQTLELTHNIFNDQENSLTSPNIIERCLQAFPNLSDLAIYFYKPDRPALLDLVDRFDKCSTKLRRLVIHTAGITNPEKYKRQFDISVFWLPRLWMFCRVVGLQGIGVTVLPAVLKSHIENIDVPWPTLKLIHFRLTGRHYAGRGSTTYRDLVDDIQKAMEKGPKTSSEHSCSHHDDHDNEDDEEEENEEEENDEENNENGNNNYYSYYDESDTTSSSSSSSEDDDDNTPIPTAPEIILHTSTIDLINFATWAFGPYGLPGLQVIAYGDFSHSPRFKWTQILLCRDPDVAEKRGGSAYPFRVMRVEDEGLLDSIAGAREMLQACPTEGVVMGEGWIEGDGWVDLDEEEEEEEDGDGNQGQDPIQDQDQDDGFGLISEE